MIKKKKKKKKKKKERKKGKHPKLAILGLMTLFSLEINVMMHECDKLENRLMIQ